METIPCPHCAAPIKPTATFCLACDTPVVDTERGLSVGEITAAPPRRRMILVAAAVGVLVVLGGGAYGVVHYVHSRSAHAESQAGADVKRSMTLLVRAESGERPACHKLAAVLAADGHNHRLECLAMVGKDPGVHLENVRTDPAHLGPLIGTVRMHATLVDAQGSRHLDEVIHLQEQTARWRMVWDGTPIA